MNRKADAVRGLSGRLKRIVTEQFDGVELRLAKALEIAGDEPGKYKGSVSDWVNGDRGISSANLLRICKVSGASAEYLLRGRGPVYSKDIPTQAVAADAETAASDQFAARVKARIAELLRDTDVQADDVYVNVNDLVDEVAHRAVVDVREELSRKSAASKMNRNLRLIRSLLLHVSGVKPQWDNSATTMLANQSADWVAKYREIIARVDQHGDEIAQWLGKQMPARAGAIHLGPYWLRKMKDRIALNFDARDMGEHTSAELEALRQLETRDASAAAIKIRNDKRRKPELSLDERMSGHTSNKSPNKTTKPRRK